MVLKGHQVVSEIKDRVDHQGHKDHLDHLVDPDHQVNKEAWDHKETL